MLNRGEGLLNEVPLKALSSGCILITDWNWITSPQYCTQWRWAGHNCTQTLAFLAIQVHLCRLNEHMGQGQDCIDRI